jgi:molecular chaperone GrpE
LKTGNSMAKHSNNPGGPGKENAPGTEKEKSPENQAEPSPDAGGDSLQKEMQEPSAQAKEKPPEERITELEAQLAEAEDRYLRKAADFENFRKRMKREKQEAIEYANQSLLLDLIHTMDDFERALKAAESMATGEFSAVYEGISMIEKRLSSQLENKWGLKRFNSDGALFDPNCHEAVQMEKSEEITEPTVLEEYYTGYTLKDRVVRSAKVKVLMPGKNEALQAGTEEGETG